MTNATAATSPIGELIRYNDRLGWRQRVRSLDYFRCLEYGWMLQLLEQLPLNATVLEWGVGTSLLPGYLAGSRSVLAMDLEPASCEWQRRNLQNAAGSLSVFRGNGLFLPFADDSIDVAVAVGALEHALEPSTCGLEGEGPSDRCYESDQGDSLALAELGRVLRPGGTLLLTVPWSSGFEFSAGSTHTETFERRYDDRELERRLIAPSGLVEQERRYFGEQGFRFSRYWYRMPFALKLPFRRLVPRASSVFLSQVDAERADQFACGVFLRLVKGHQSAERAS